MVKDSERGDSGPFTLKLTNPSGTVEGTIQVTVLGNVLLITSVLYSRL